CFFFFSSRRRHTRSYGDWSSDVCSSDLTATGEILRIISSSPTEVTPVYEAIAQAAARVLDAPSATVRVRDRDELQIVAHVWPQRSEERRVGKEGRARWWPEPAKKKRIEN